MRPIIFCDFDGTITESDNIISLMKEFGPEGWRDLADAVLNKKISISEGVGKMFSLLESSKKDEIIRFVESNAVIRPGFREFTGFAKEQNIPFYVVSGGIDFFVEPMLKPFNGIAGVYCNRASFKKDYIEVEWPHSCDSSCSKACGCCKPSIMRSIASEKEFKIVIGDSITDLEAAKIADLVIARDYLSERCAEEGIPYHPFTTFYDCMEIVAIELGAAV
ncbi:2-hydroxy-3-keto-5-methylthiopentenyl-1-phosphate phosphatase [Peribacillus sp. SCS-26]|uniref:2-hydroxy-3-keto-5-methylthiopentenyl-1- phosphate phosphatase n=1 Tax=Paraperibacillus marinus TaxID=3115295 RepID=UPI0039062E6C